MTVRKLFKFFVAIVILSSISFSAFVSASVVGETFTGTASYYSKSFDGSRTATGEIFRNKLFTGASNNLRLHTWVRVTNLRNGKAVTVRINDRMHPSMAKKGRVIDLSHSAASKLGFINRGITKVKLEVVPAGTVKVE